MTLYSPTRRAGFTLVELLVVMSVIIVLTTLALAVYPDTGNDRTTDAAATIRQHLMIAKSRATRENNGRGIRFILDGGLSDPLRVAAGTPGTFLSTEMQYIEAAPTLIPNPLGLTGTTDPYVEFDPTNANPALRCLMKNIAGTHEVITVMNNDLGARWFPMLYCPVLGPDAFGRTQRFEVQRLTPGPVANSWSLTLDRQPYTLIGAGTTQRVYRFAVEPRSRPLLGEPNIPLPKNVCVDLNPFVSIPGARVVNGQPIDFEIMFSPNGQVIDPVSSGMIYLWVRDYSKVPNVTPLTPNAGAPSLPYTYAPGPTQFQAGGEMQLVALKAKTGALGVFPVLWPNAGGAYNPGPPQQSPFFLAARDANGP